MRVGYFVVSAKDNVDKNSRSTAATMNMHGTTISLFQFQLSLNGEFTVYTGAVVIPCKHFLMNLTAPMNDDKAKIHSSLRRHPYNGSFQMNQEDRGLTQRLSMLRKLPPNCQIAGRFI